MPTRSRTATSAQAEQQQEQQQGLTPLPTAKQLQERLNGHADHLSRLENLLREIQITQAQMGGVVEELAKQSDRQDAHNDKVSDALAALTLIVNGLKQKQESDQDATFEREEHLALLLNTKISSAMRYAAIVFTLGTVAISACAVFVTLLVNK